MPRRPTGRGDDSRWQRKGITLSGLDAVIAASAIRCGAVLVTTNPRHFPMRELTVMGVDEEGRPL
jgi:hypothetical protein